MQQPARVVITGAAGQIGYQLAFRIASGQMLGTNQPVILQLLEIPPALGALNGVVMELEDCAFPTLHGVVATDQAEVAFADADYALLVGAKPRGPGMERSDLLKGNAQIFSAQGKGYRFTGVGRRSWVSRTTEGPSVCSAGYGWVGYKEDTLLSTDTGYRINTTGEGRINRNNYLVGRGTAIGIGCHHRVSRCTRRRYVYTSARQVSWLPSISNHSGATGVASCKCCRASFADRYIWARGYNWAILLGEGSIW